MHYKGLLLFVLIAGALVAAGCSSTGTDARAGFPSPTAQPTTVLTTVPTITPTTLPITTVPTPTPISDKTFTELMNENLIGVTAQGLNIQYVDFSVKNRVDRAILFTVPIGTVLDSQGGSYQSMITTQAEEASILPMGNASLRIPAACTDIDLDVPESTNTFGYIGSSSNARLVSVLKSLDDSGANSNTVQAAVWIISDDADWYDLGTLVTGSGKVRAIDEAEAATAMRAVDQSGIDITSKAIWRDKSTILAGLRDSSLKSWLENKY